MLNRIGKVIWWLGAIVMISALGVFGSSWGINQKRLDDCPATMRLKAEIETSHDQAVERYLREHPTEGKYSADFAVSGSDARQTQSYFNDVAFCEHPPEGSFTLGLSLAISFGIGFAMWALAFVFGGSFWSPPKNRD